jgi:CheY-like chemotaxis protein
MMSEMDIAFEHSPVPLLVVDQDDMLIRCNSVATTLGIETGRSLKDYLVEQGGSFVGSLGNTDTSTSYLFNLPHAEKRFAVHFIKDGQFAWVWLRDLTEQMALAEQVRQLRRPEQKRIRNVYHQVITALGYAELLDVIMEDNQVLSAEKLNSVRQYQADLTGALRRIQQIISEQPLDIADQKMSVIVVDSHQDLTDLLTELLQTEGFKVKGFTDAASALKYCAVSSGGIQKAVIDDAIRDDQNVPLSIALKSLSPDTDIVFLSSEDKTPGAIPKPVDFQLLLQAMLD